MAQYSELPVYKATYDLLRAILQFTKDFNKEYKYTVGESLKKDTIKLITLIYRANSRSDKSETLQTVREHIEVIRLLIRLEERDGVKYFIIRGGPFHSWDLLSLADCVPGNGLMNSQWSSPIRRVENPYGRAK